MLERLTPTQDFFTLATISEIPGFYADESLLVFVDKTGNIVNIGDPKLEGLEGLEDSYNRVSSTRKGPSFILVDGKKLGPVLVDPSKITPIKVNTATEVLDAFALGPQIDFWFIENYSQFEKTGNKIKRENGDSYDEHTRIYQNQGLENLRVAAIPM